MVDASYPGRQHIDARTVDIRLTLPIKLLERNRRPRTTSKQQAQRFCTDGVLGNVVVYFAKQDYRAS